MPCLHFAKGIDCGGQLHSEAEPDPTEKIRAAQSAYWPLVELAHAISLSRSADDLQDSNAPFYVE